MRKLALLLTTLLAFASTLLVRADTLVNTFSQPFDYVLDGVLGDTNWDGIYLRNGDIFNSTGGNGVANTPTANTESFPGLLGVQNIGGNWTGGSDNGFFLYKLVQGDFDVSVETVPGMFSGGTGTDNRANNFFGLQIRLVNTNASGDRFSTTSTNHVENSLRLWRFNEFGFDGTIRQSTNGANFEAAFPSPGVAAQSTDTNTTRFYRITRSGNTFTFYLKTNASDDWLIITNGGASGGYVPTNGGIQRPDFAGQWLQVGVVQAAFSGASRDALFGNFTLIASNYTMFPPMPSAPSNLIETGSNTKGSLSFSWTLGTPGDSSLVVISRTNIQHNPGQGVTYLADSNNAYGDTNTWIGGATEYVVYSGPNNSVTVTNLGANIINYNVAVYEYNPNGGSPIYNTLSPVTNTYAGPGIITGAILNVSSTNLPTGGAAIAHMLGSFSTGETSDQSASTTWSSSDPTIFSVDTSGTISAITNGTATLQGVFGSFTLTTNITVHTPVFADNFSTSHDYLANGLIGSGWDGLYLKSGDVPGGTNSANGAANTLNADAQITDTNGLYISSVNSTWAGTADNGPFLFKVVPGTFNGVSGDFEVSAHITSMGIGNGVFAGIMARVFNTANGGGPSPASAENHVEYWKVQNGTTSIRRTSANTTTTVVAAGPSGTDGYLLIQRSGSTNFYFFEKASAAATWTFVTNVVLASASNNAAMQVGMAEQTTLGINATATFNNSFMDAAGITTPNTPPAAATGMTTTLNSDLSITIKYTVGVDQPANTVTRSLVIVRDGGPVTAQPYTGLALAGNSSFGDPANYLGGGNYVVYRSVSGDANLADTNQSVTVTGLTPGHTYYVAVYTFIGLGTTRTFNQNASTSNGSQQDGSLLFIDILPTPPIPLNGIGQIQAIGHFSGGATLNISPFAVITITNLTGFIKQTNGILSGITNGTATATLVYQGVTNTSTLTVQDGTFTDNFTTPHDYVASGVTGSGWDNLYNPNGYNSTTFNPIPGSTYLPNVGDGPTTADADLSTNGYMRVVSQGNGWEGGDVGGFFLFKYVPGDFQMSVHISRIDNYFGNTNNPNGLVQNYNQPGLLARAYYSSNGVTGYPFGYQTPGVFGTNDAGEYWVNIVRFDEFGFGTYTRITTDGRGDNPNNVGGTLQNTQPDQGDEKMWLLIKRSNFTEFDYYKRKNISDPWEPIPNKTHYSIPAFNGKPMQVGLIAGPWFGTSTTDNSAYRTVEFDHFMMNEVSGGPLSGVLDGNGNIVLSWAADPNAVLESSPSLGTPNWQPVGGTPTLGNDIYSQTVPLNTAAGATIFYRLVH